MAFCLVRELIVLRCAAQVSHLSTRSAPVLHILVATFASLPRSTLRLLAQMVVRVCRRFREVRKVQLHERPRKDGENVEHLRFRPGHVGLHCTIVDVNLTIAIPVDFGRGH